jgi:hypothetical protein
MQSLQQPYYPSYAQTEKRKSTLSHFFSWCSTQEKYRYGWLAAIITLHGCVLTPATLLTVTLGSNSIILWAMAMAAMAMSLISNLAAMPTRITIPIFFFSVGIDLMIIGISLNTMFLIR